MKLSLSQVAPLVLFVASLCVSCGPKPAPEVVPPPVVEAKQTLQGASELRAEVSHERISLSWKTNRDEKVPIMGYNIYVWSEKDSSAGTNQGFHKITDEPYPGDINPDVTYETYPLEDVSDGMVYRAYVATVYTGRIESPASDTVEAIPRPEGTFTLRESFKGSESGFSFKKLKSVPTGDLENDIYLATINGVLNIASPHRIDNVYRQSKFIKLAQFGSLDKVVPEGRIGEPDNVLQIYSGQIFLIVNQDNCYVLAKFDSVDANKKTVRISYIYQPRSNTLRFH